MGGRLFSLQRLLFAPAFESLSFGPSFPNLPGTFQAQIYWQYFLENYFLIIALIMWAGLLIFGICGLIQQALEKKRKGGNQ
jgi:hypothetical protein